VELEIDPAGATGRPGDEPSTIVDTVRNGLLDAELAGRLWVLVDGGVPVIVSGQPAADARGQRAIRDDLADAILDLVPTTRRRLDLTGASEDFAWLPDAERLGWVRSSPVDPQAAGPAVTTLIGGELGPAPPADLIGDRVRLVVRALGRGFGLVATIDAAGLEEVLASLRRRPIFLTDDELSNLGIVLVAGRTADHGADPADPASPATTRIVAAHYVRPLARDVHGHTQRLPPAVLATWDQGIGRFEHFAWGIAGELAERVGRRSGDFEAECERRAAVLAALAMAVDEPMDRPTLLARLDHQRAVGGTAAGAHRH
jgi:hypothetical protein